MSIRSRRKLLIHPTVDLRTLRLRYDRLAYAHDRMAGRVMVAEAEVRRLGRVGARQIDRLIEAQTAAATARAALEAAQTRPAAAVRLLLRVERFLYRLSYPRCASCKLATPPHRHNCRLERLIVAIQKLIPL